MLLSARSPQYPNLVTGPRKPVGSFAQVALAFLHTTSYCLCTSHSISHPLGFWTSDPTLVPAHRTLAPPQNAGQRSTAAPADVATTLRNIDVATRAPVEAGGGPMSMSSLKQYGHLIMSGDSVGEGHEEELKTCGHEGAQRRTGCFFDLGG